MDAVITTCCTFNPTPSLSAFVVNRFGLRHDVKTYSLGGMGCSASVIALDLANELLKVLQGWGRFRDAMAASHCNSSPSPYCGSTGASQRPADICRAMPRVCPLSSRASLRFERGRAGIAACGPPQCARALSNPGMRVLVVGTENILDNCTVPQRGRWRGEGKGGKERGWAADRAPSLAQSNPGMRVLVAGTENILDNLYWGNQRSMLITCCIFRLGGVAALLSSRRADARRAKYRLQHLVRTHLGASDQAYKCGPRPAPPAPRPACLCGPAPRASTSGDKCFCSASCARTCAHPTRLTSAARARAHPARLCAPLRTCPARLCVWYTRDCCTPYAHAPDAPAGACSAVQQMRCSRRWGGAAGHSHRERGCNAAARIPRSVAATVCRRRRR